MASCPSPKLPSKEAFQIDVPVIAFEKADEPAGQHKRIAGIISTDSLDQQQERLLQEGLNFKTFLERGFFNDNHQSHTTTSVIGYPKSVKSYQKGETLPNGDKAPANLTWTEGFLCGKRGREIWDLAHDLRDSGRTLGFSVEGSIQARKSEDQNVVTSADVHSVAVCARPVNAECRLMTLVRSLDAAQTAAKAFTLGTVPAQSEAHPIPQPAPNVPKVGEGAGQVLGTMFAKKKKRLKKKLSRTASTQKSVQGPANDASLKGANLLSKAEALHWIRKAVPGVTDATADAFYQTAQRLVALGLA